MIKNLKNTSIMQKNSESFITNENIYNNLFKSLKILNLKTKFIMF